MGIDVDKYLPSLILAAEMVPFAHRSYLQL